MVTPRSLRRAALPILLAVAAALAWAALPLSGVAPASAQICPDGTIVYGQSCPSPSAPSTGGTVPSSTYIIGTAPVSSNPGYQPGVPVGWNPGYATCPDGSVVYPGQTCANGATWCPSGVFAPQGWPCPGNG